MADPNDSENAAGWENVAAREGLPLRLPPGALSRIRALGSELATRLHTGIDLALEQRDERIINQILERDGALFALLEMVSYPKDMRLLRKRAAELRFDVEVKR
jgi:hypothetical protein